MSRYLNVTEAYPTNSNCPVLGITAISNMNSCIASIMLQKGYMSRAVSNLWYPEYYTKDSTSCGLEEM